MPMNVSFIKKFVRLLEISIKSIIEDLQKCNVWAKKHVKSLQEWLKAYIDFGLQTQKLNTPIKMRLINFLFFLYCVLFPNILIVMMIPFKNYGSNLIFNFLGNKIYNQIYHFLISFASF